MLIYLDIDYIDSETDKLSLFRRRGWQLPDLNRSCSCQAGLVVPGSQETGLEIRWRRSYSSSSRFRNSMTMNPLQLLGTSENPVLLDSIFRWGLLGTALDDVGGRMRTARRATRDVDVI